MLAESGVVVGADGSEHSVAAVRFAADTAVAYGLPLTILYARPDAEAEPTLLTEPTGVLGAATAVAPAAQPGDQGLADARRAGAVAVGCRRERRRDRAGSRGVEGFRACCWVRPLCMSLLCAVPGCRGALRPGRRGAFREHRGYPGNPGQVVLGYDGSSASNRAAAFAFRHAEAIGCAVVAVSVEPSRGEPETEEIDPESATPGSDTSAFHSPVIVIAASFPDVPVTFVAGTGRPAEVLLSQARGAALLVVGSRGTEGFSGLIMGSVSQKVVAHAECPVAVLHQGCQPETAAGIA